MPLPAQLEGRLAASLAAELAKVERVERAAFDAASRSSAYAGRRLYEVHVASAARVRASPDPEKLDVLLRNIAHEVGLASEVLTEAERRTLLGAAREIGGGIARDAGRLAAETGRGWMALLKASPLVILGLALVVFTRSAAGAAGGGA